MATISTFIDNISSTEFLAQEGTIAHIKLDFSETNVSNADVVQSIQIPQGAFVTAVYVRIRTAEGGVATADIGDATDANGWDALIDLNAVATTTTRSEDGTDAFAVGKLYTVADTIDVVPTADLDTAVIDVFAEYAIIKEFA